MLEKMVKLKSKQLRTYTIEEKDTAEFIGSGSVRLLATPQLAAWMEQIAHGMLQRMLKPGMVDLGVEIFLRHMSSAEVGEKVEIDVTVVQVMGSRVTFEVGAEIEDRIVARGTHVRQVLRRDKKKNSVEG